MTDSTPPHQPPSPWQPGGPPTPGPQPHGASEFPTAPVQAGQPLFEGEVPTYDRGEPGGGRRTVALAAVIALVVGLGVGFAVGRQTAPKGATSLAQAIQLASAGKLPTGDLSSVRGNLGGAFRRGLTGRGQAGNGQATPGAGGQGSGGNGANGNGFLFGGGQGNRGIQATVSSISGDTLTLDTAAGQLRVRIGPDTRIQKAAPGARSDISPGSRVVVNFDLSGGTGSDGSVAASSILAEGQSQ